MIDVNPMVMGWSFVSASSAVQPMCLKVMDHMLFGHCDGNMHCSNLVGMHCMSLNFLSLEFAEELCEVAECKLPSSELNHSHSLSGNVSINASETCTCTCYQC